MSILKLKNRIELFDYLVRNTLTGTPTQFARKLGMSKTSLYLFIEELAAMNIPVVYNKERKNYEYCKKGKLVFGFQSLNHR